MNLSKSGPLIKPKSEKNESYPVYYLVNQKLDHNSHTIIVL